MPFVGRIFFGCRVQELSLLNGAALGDKMLAEQIYERAMMKA
jgi:hypothetical protein